MHEATGNGHSVLLYVILLIQVIVQFGTSVGLLWLLSRAVLVLKELADAKRREVNGPQWISGQAESAAGQKREAAAPEVPLLPPEVIAPYIRRPPSAAGFGASVISADDGDRQFEQESIDADKGGQTTSTGPSD